MKKVRFVLVGAGWRALYYVRIAKALPQYFELCAVFCRTEEKAKALAASNSVHTTVSMEECQRLRPDFVVVAVKKEAIAAVSEEWLNNGFAVLSETPASLDLSVLHHLWELKNSRGFKMCVAEQYRFYPVYQTMLNVLDKGLIGDPVNVTISLAHEYHGASLIRAFLREGIRTPFEVSAKEYAFPTTETLNRYERITDGRIAEKKRMLAAFTFADGKAAFYDFDSEQYRSPIRNHYIKVQGCRGEMKDEVFYYLDGNNEPICEPLRISEQKLCGEPEYAGLIGLSEITGITFHGTEVYTPVFGLCNLAPDETAIAHVMLDMALYVREEKEPDYPLEYALQDAYMAILLKEAAQRGEVIKSTAQPWQIYKREE